MSFNKEVFTRIFVFGVCIKFDRVDNGKHTLPTSLQVGTLFYNEGDSQFYLSVIDDYQAFLKVTYMTYLEDKDLEQLNKIMKNGAIKAEWREDVKAWNKRNENNLLDFEEVEVAARSLKCMQLGHKAFYGVWKMLMPLQIFSLKGNEKKAMAEYYYRTLKHSFPKRKKGDVRTWPPKHVEDIEDRIREYYEGKKYRWDYIVRDPRETKGEISYGQLCNKNMHGFVLN